MITIEIHNADELARRESLFARAFGGFAGDLIRRRVDERVASELREALAARGVQARVTVE